MSKTVAKTVLSDALHAILADAELFGAEGPCPARLTGGSGLPAVVLVTGDNASGKSFLCQRLGQHLTNGGLHVDYVGMAFRTQRGMAAAMTFGDESQRSTGEVSVRMVRRKLAKDEGGRTRVVILDEPDIGLAENYTAAMGQFIASACAGLPEDVAGVVVVTHSRTIAAAVNDLGPWAVRIGDDMRPTEEWLRDGPRPVGVDDLERLGEVAHATFLRITRIKEARKARAEAEKQRLAREHAERGRSAKSGYREAMRGGDGFGPAEREAARAYLEYLLDDRARSTGRTDGIKVAADGEVSYGGTRVGTASLAVVNAGQGRRRVVATLASGAGDAKCPLTEDGVYEAWHDVFSASIPSGGRRY